jgi:uncharacterized protein YidB (DUF937 family)
MGLLDVLNGMQNGPRGSSSGGGMSPITMGLLGLLAYKAVKSFSNTSATGGAPASPGVSGGGFGGGLGDLLRGLGGGSPAASGSGLPAGGLGGLLSGGLDDLVRQFQGAGKGDIANSWVGTGQNKPIAPADLGNVLTDEQIAFLMARTGLSREELLAGLSEHLPQAVNHLTPDGRLPTPDEMNRTL